MHVYTNYRNEGMGQQLWLPLKNYGGLSICCFSTKHMALRRKSKDWLARNQDRTVVSVHELINVNEL
jgi:hypothetical protein